MRLIDAQSAGDYLRQAGRVGPNEAVRVRELTGGVSNMVLLVERPEHAGASFVVKQARPQLRTHHPWFSSLERAWREAEVLTVCARLLAAQSAGSRRGASIDEAGTAHTPSILFEDRDNYLFGMTAAPQPNAVWKQELLGGRVDAPVAAACGRLLGTLHGGSWLDPAIAGQLGDRSLFDELRVDPYYRTLAAVHGDVRGELHDLIVSLADHRRSLVHADFSPKNLLLYPGGLMMVDFETGHYGDPAFDLGFFLSHLVLKACAKIPRQGEYLHLTEVFRQHYSDQVEERIGPRELADLWSRGVRNFAACAWARLDGKSPVDYLVDPKRRDMMRQLCRRILVSPPPSWSEVIAICQHDFDRAGRGS
jgi:5-methylthioribose kinase